MQPPQDILQQRQDSGMRRCYSQVPRIPEPTVCSYYTVKFTLPHGYTILMDQLMLAS
jgi:hypothetical protein